MVSWIAVGSVTPGRYSTVACAVARLTAARETPGTALKPCSILATQEAQDIPSITTVSVVGLAAPAVVPPPSRGTPTLVPLPWRERVGVRGASASAGLG